MSEKSAKELTDLRNASLEELEEMQGKLSKFIERRLQVRKQEALDKIRSLAQEYDLTYDEVVAAVRTVTKRGKAPPIYRNPANPRQTWSGKGEPPSWFASHPSPEKLRIPGA
jgi:DNA-binding protein H-NS